MYPNKTITIKVRLNIGETISGISVNWVKECRKGSKFGKEVVAGRNESVVTRWWDKEIHCITICKMTDWKTLDVLQWENGWINCSSIHIHCLFKRQDSWPLPQSLSLRYGRGSRRRDFLRVLSAMPVHVVFGSVCIWSFIPRLDFKLNYKTRWAICGPLLFITF